MAIRQERGGNYWSHCHTCREVEELSGTFDESVIELKRLGWIARKVNDAWIHYCPSCIEDINAAAAKQAGLDD